MQNFLHIVIVTLLFGSIISQDDCSNNCSGHGQCLVSQCYCDSEWLGRSCSLPATEIRIGESSQLDAAPNAWGYFYLNLQGIDDNLNIDIGGDFAFFRANTLLSSRNDFDVPTESQFYKTYSSRELAETMISLYQTEIRRVENGRFVIGIFNSGSEPLPVRVLVYFKDSMEVTGSVNLSFIIIALTVAVVLYITSMALYICRRRKNCRNRARNLNQVENHVARRIWDIEAQIVRVAVLSPFAADNEKSHLFPKDVEKYFPKTPYNNLKTSFPQTTCSVCLEEFQKDSKCHQLYCEHIFHDVCIQMWLSKHDSCPDCRKTMTKEAIEKSATLSSATLNSATLFSAATADRKSVV